MLFFAIFWITVYYFSGLFFSGFAFSDDYQVVQIKHELLTSQESFIHIAKKWIENDLYQTKRFRPAYELYKVIQASLYGYNYQLYYFNNCLWAIISCFSLFYFSRSALGFNIFGSFIFAILSLFGSQTQIFYALGPAESIGIVFLSLSLVFLSLSINKHGYRTFYDLCFLIFALLSSLSKESFILFIPVLIYWKVYLSKNKFNLTRTEAIRKNLIVLFALITILLVELVFIKLYIRNTNIGYAGYKGIDLMKIAQAFFELLSLYRVYILIIIGALLVFLSEKRASSNNGKDIVNRWFKHSNALIIFFLIITPQILLYSSSGFMFHRYYLPAVIGIAYILAYLSDYISKSLFLKRYLRTFYAALLICFILQYSFNYTYRYFSQTSEGITKGRKLVDDIILKTNKNSQILIVGNPITSMESIYALKSFLNILGSRDSLNYYYCYNEKDINNDTKWVLDFSEREITAHKNLYNNKPIKDEFDCIVILKDKNANFNSFYSLNKTLIESEYNQSTTFDNLYYLKKRF